MAGIGFELKKVAVRGGILSITQVAFSGALIVAGPWMISILNITFAQQFLNEYLAGNSEYLIEMMVYSYAISLTVFGGFHYPFTRMLSDLIYERKEKEALIQTILFSLMIGAVSFGFCLLLTSFLEIPLASPRLYRLSTALFFAAVNILWIVMLFISVLKWFYKIVLAYIAGAAATQVFLKIFPAEEAIEWVIFAFALGQVVIVLLLLLFSLTEYAGGREWTIKPLFKYMKKYRIMFNIGLFYNAGLWIDKIVFWIFRGTSEGGTVLPLYSAYDTSVYLANLAIIPGLIYFVTVTETNFYILLKKFLFSLKSSIYRDITIKKYKMINRARKDLIDQSLLQGIVMIILILLSPFIVEKVIASTNPLVLTLSITAVFLYLIFLTTLNFHFYLEAYRDAAWLCFGFFGINLVLSVVTVFFPAVPPGAGYVLACGFAAVSAYYSLKKNIRFFDRKIFIAAGNPQPD